MTSESCTENIRIQVARFTQLNICLKNLSLYLQILLSILPKRSGTGLRILTLELRSYLKTMKNDIRIEKVRDYRSKKYNTTTTEISVFFHYMDLLKVPRTDTSFGLRRFSVAEPRIWNGLPHELRQCNTLPCFKSHLKTYYFRHHMDN